MELYGKGMEATNLASGLMSAADKAKLDRLSEEAVGNLSAVDSTIVIADKNGETTLGVRLSKESGNILTVKDDGLYAQPTNITWGDLDSTQSS